VPELAAMRQALPEVIVLVSGFGAQGGSAADVAAGFRPDGLGAVVNSSRGILFPFAPEESDWEHKVEAAARDTAVSLAAAARLPSA
jgi:orotidine-5'-phosphate decarboxylase